MDMPMGLSSPMNESLHILVKRNSHEWVLLDVKKGRLALFAGLPARTHHRLQRTTSGASRWVDDASQCSATHRSSGTVVSSVPEYDGNRTIGKVDWMDQNSAPPRT